MQNREPHFPDDPRISSQGERIAKNESQIVTLFNSIDRLVTKDEFKFVSWCVYGMTGAMGASIISALMYLILKR